MAPETLAVLDAIFAGMVRLSKSESEASEEYREGLAAARYWLVGFVQGDYGVNLVERYREKRDAL